MPFLALRTPRLSVLRLVTLAGSLWADVARTDPPHGQSPSGGHVVTVQDDPGATTTDELGEYIEQLERHLDWMHTRAEWRKDADTVAAVEAIQKKLAVAKDQHRALCRLCAEELHDTPMARECCQVIDDTMHEVIDDHLALMRRLRERRRRPHPIRRIKTDTFPVPSLRRGQLSITRATRSPA